MILPYFSKLRASTSPIRKELSLLEPQSPPAHTYKELFDGFDGASQLHGGSRPQREGSADMNGIARPSLPGAWQTEEDLHAASNTWTDQNHAVERGGSPGLSTDNVTDKTLQGHESSQQFQDMAGRTMVAQKDVISTEPHQDTLAKDMDELNLKQNDDSLKALSDEDKNDPYYHAAEILANAKKRLTVSSDDGVIARLLVAISDFLAIGHGRESDPSTSLSQCYWLHIQVGNFQWGCQNSIPPDEAVPGSRELEESSKQYYSAHPRIERDVRPVSNLSLIQDQTCGLWTTGWINCSGIRWQSS